MKTFAFCAVLTFCGLISSESIFQSPNKTDEKAGVCYGYGGGKSVRGRGTCLEWSKCDDCEGTCLGSGSGSGRGGADSDCGGGGKRDVNRYVCCCACWTWCSSGSKGERGTCMDQGECYDNGGSCSDNDADGHGGFRCGVRRKENEKEISCCCDFGV